MARCYLDRVTGFKRTKDGVSPDTISDRPGSKVAKKLAQAVLPKELRSTSLHDVFQGVTKQTLELGLTR